jgi:YD repeat-containing protein
MTYDAENRLLNFNGGAGQYFYDGDGHRVKKIDSTGATVFGYNVAGQLIAEYTSGPPPGGGTSYFHKSSSPSLNRGLTGCLIFGVHSSRYGIVSTRDG